MSRNEYSDSERDQWVLCIAEGCRKTAVHKLFMDKYERVLQQGLRYENGTKYINQKGVMNTGLEMGAPE